MIPSNEPRGMPQITLSIAAVERDTGLSKDTLRVWERRYGFPSPQRDAIGERAYTLDHVEKLRVIKRLLDAGHRPGRIVPLSFEELQKLTDSTVDQPARSVEAPLGSADVLAYIGLIRSHDLAALRGQLSRQMARLGIGRFVNDVIAPLNIAVGDAWIRGQMEVFEEHTYSETVQVVLRQAIAGVPPPPAGSGPTVLLTTFPGEPHGLGLLMAEAIFALEGCSCVSLGTQTPLWDIVMAAGAHRVDIVALGFTGCMNPNQVVDGLQELRGKLPARLQVWAGGGAPVLQRRRVDGVTPLESLDQIVSGIRQWRAANA
jgi:DNA-binding transcriptional MerR regulator/methylmalonyl-CoA mutase cobalamin-binding subunit